MLQTRTASPARSSETEQLKIKLYEIEQVIRWLRPLIKSYRRQVPHGLDEQLQQAEHDAYVIRRQLRTMASK